MSSKRLLWMALLLALVPGLAAAQGTGQLTGVVTGPGDVPLSGVTVVIDEAGMAEITDGNGRYTLVGLPAGTYTVTLSLGERVSTVEGVAITPGQTTSLDHAVDWEVSFAETITVFSASRRRERVVEAPAAVTVIAEEQLEREAASGQLAKVLEFTPGAQVTQSGLYDFNLNTRGFNSSLNRRVPALVDGRDATVPFLMSNDWPSMSSLGDMASVELVRGPSSALYGTNAFNGVLVLTTKQPRYSQGGMVQLTAGELATRRGDVRWSGGLTESTYLKAHGSYTQSEDFYVSRVPTFFGGTLARPEYSVFCTTAGQVDCLVAERSPVAVTEDELWLGGIRLDHYVGNSFFTIEGGTSHAEGPVLQTGIGRVQVLESDRPWARFNFSHPRWNLLAYRNERDAPRQRALSRAPVPVGGNNLVLDESNQAVEIQGNLEFAQSKGRVVGGASYKEEEIDTEGTLTARVVGAERQAVYGQIEYAFGPKLKAVAAARWDAAEDIQGGDLHDDEISPKLAVVFAPTSNQTIRLSYNQAFQSPNFSEFFLSTPAGAPITAFTPLENALAPFLGGQTLGLRSIPLLARGNSNLLTEEVTTYEIGYSGIIAGKTFLTVDYYQSEMENFVTDLLPGANPAFAPYAPPAFLPAPVRTQILNTLRGGLGGNFAGLTTINGLPALVLSYTNAGTVDTEGIDFGVNVYVTNAWNVAFNYSWFDFEVQDFGRLLGPAQAQLLPNSPETSASASVGFNGERFDASVSGRWVDDFRWAAGVFVGDVPSYTTMDLTAGFDVTDSVRLGLSVTNLTDEEHWQSFGGDVLGRRALGSVAFSW